MLFCCSMASALGGSLAQLQYLSLVSKVCQELENHYNLNDKTLAEFLIDLASQSDTVEGFAQALAANDAAFGDAFISNLFTIIKKMRPHVSKQQQPSPPQVLTFSSVLLFRLPLIMLVQTPFFARRWIPKKTPEPPQHPAHEVALAVLRRSGPKGVLALVPPRRGRRSLLGTPVPDRVLVLVQNLHDDSTSTFYFFVSSAMTRKCHFRAIRFS